MRAIYQDILRRAYDSLWHPSVRWPKLYSRDYQGYDNWRYPAPGSENNTHIEHDFKTPYRESMYHVREAEIERNHEFYYFFADPISETPKEKLVRLRFLDKKDINNEKAVELAKQKYSKENQEPLEQKILLDETEQSNLQLFINQNKSREALASLVKKQFEEIRECSEENLIEGNLKDDYKPQFLDRVDLNLFANDPVARQFQLDIRVTLQKLGEQHYKEGYQSFFVGDPNYWHALDNSFTPQQIKLVQSAAQDDVSLLDPKTLQAVQNSNEYHKEKRVKLPFKNEYYK